MISRNIVWVPLDYLGMAVGMLAATMSLCFMGSYIYILVNLNEYAQELHNALGTDLAVIKKDVTKVIAVGIAVNACMFVSSIVLILAAIKMSAKMVLPWLINIVCYFIFFLAVAILLAKTRKDILTEFKTTGAITGLGLTCGFVILGGILMVLLYLYLRYQNF